MFGKCGPGNTWAPYLNRFMANPPHSPQDLRVLSQLVQVFEQLGIPYAVGGSMASSAYGIVRFTQDADIAVAPFADQAQRFCELVQQDFYISLEAMMQAIQQRSSFNVIHFESAFKIDIFICKDTAFERELLSRRQLLKWSDSDDDVLAFVSPEDIILLKLRWYHEGGRLSERQWRDVLGVLTIQGKKLDYGYLEQQACGLGINDLLKQVMQEKRDG